MELDFEVIKRHPYATGAAVIGGALVLYLLIHRGSAASAASSGGIDPNVAAQIAAQAQSQQTAASAQIQQEQYGLSLAQIDAASKQNLATITANSAYDIQALSAGVDLARINAEADTTNKQIAAQVQESADQLAVQSQDIAARVAINSQNVQGTEYLAGVAADTNTKIAQFNATTQQQLITSEADVVKAQTNANVAIAKAYSTSQMWSSIAASVAGIF